MTRTSLRMHVLDGGTIDVNDWRRFRPGAAPGARKRIPDPCYVILHPSGALLWDTGISDDVRAHPDGVQVSETSVFRVTRSLGEQLYAIGLSRASVDFVALSHFHRDHAGNVAGFPDACFLAQQDEFTAALDAETAAPGYRAEELAPLRTARQKRLHGDHDVFGDGSVVIKRSPGHTAGHQSLLVRLPDTGPVLLSGDLVHCIENWVDGAVPEINHDRDASLASIREARAVLAAEHASLWVQHDPGRYAATHLGPYRYE